MNTKTTIAVSCLALYTWSGIAQADHHMEAEAASFEPVEIFTCSYNDGQDQGDLDRVIGRYNKWADKNDKDYTAFVMTKGFTNSEQDFDILWLGVWDDGHKMGAGTDNFITNSGSLQAEFDKVLTCPVHQLNASVNIKPPMNETPPDTSVVTFSSCTLAEGKSPEDGFEAHTKWAAYLTENGSKAGMWILYPGIGSGDTDFDYYVVMAHPDYTSVGHDFELFGNGGGWRKAGEIFGGVVSCDGARAYNSRVVRRGEGS